MGYAELRTDALRFTELEIEELFRDIYNDPLDPSEVAELERRTEGWAASLQLVEVSLRERPTREDRQRFIQSITATKDSDLFDFLAEEVLDQQPEETRNFLLSTSILQQITPEVAERLAGVHDGRRELTDLEQRGLFTNRLDEERFRYHNLFREFLERRLISERTDAEVVGLHIHAASYFETTEQWPEAIHHYLKAGLQRQAARLIAKYGEEVVAEGRLGLVDEWLQQLPEETIKQNARLSLLFGEACGIRGDWTRALESLERARAFFARKGDRRLEALACLKLSSVYSNYGDPDTAWRLADEGLGLAPPDARALRLRLEGDLAVTRTWLTDGLPAVAAACRRIAVEATDLGMEHYASIALHNLGYLESEMGKFSDAVLHLQRAARFWAELPPNPFADFSDLAVALLAMGEQDRAARLTATAVEMTKSWPRPMGEALYGRAMVLAYHGPFGDAIKVMRDPLEASEALGTGRTALGALMIDCLYLSHGPSEEVEQTMEAMSRGPVDRRLRLLHVVAQQIANHAQERCLGQCQDAWNEVEYWSGMGMVTTPAAAALKLAVLAFEHKDRSAPRKAVEALLRAQSHGVLRTNRWWIRRLSPYALRLARQREGRALLRTLVDADPEGWRIPSIDALPRLSGHHRTQLLTAISLNASRETTLALAEIDGDDVLEVVRQLQIRQAPRLYMRLFGPLTLERGTFGGPSITVGKRRLRSMLALLGAHAGTPLTRDQIIEILWPDADISSGLNNFNQTMFQLRRELDPSGREGDTLPYVASSVDSVHLHPDLVRTDVDELRRLHHLLDEEALPQRRRTASKMLDLVRGEFLLDFRYEDWAHSLQLRVHAEVRSLLSPLLLADGIEFSRELGVRAACALLALDEYDETAQFALIRQLAASGRRAAARSAAKRYAERLRAELDEEPGPEFDAVLASLDSGA